MIVLVVSAARRYAEEQKYYPIVAPSEQLVNQALVEFRDPNCAEDAHLDYCYCPEVVAVMPTLSLTNFALVELEWALIPLSEFAALKYL